MSHIPVFYSSLTPSPLVSVAIITSLSYLLLWSNLTSLSSLLLNTSQWPLKKELLILALCWYNLPCAELFILCNTFFLCTLQRLPNPALASVLSHHLSPHHSAYTPAIGLYRDWIDHAFLSIVLTSVTQDLPLWSLIRSTQLYHVSPLGSNTAIFFLQLPTYFSSLRSKGASSPYVFLASSAKILRFFLWSSFSYTFGGLST